ncbi:pilus assembly protein [Quatrionicoccus australiensis]|uniref:pilus assembly protein n=1 Tax=Quatrionicoccus australiensis TaxID=138118 RepID=UPI001CF9E38F|nr:PilC/PilY family type IV pilus protein [Quatrionicoccus australiensis]MCB4361256.1 PQQ-binding-like beta-propeller repeat protein [Quatrionicoccus australiensis]
MKIQNNSSQFVQRLVARTAAIALCLGSSPFSYAADIPTVPLQANVSTDPNVMMILDDSGSMQFEIMPDDYTLGATYYVFPRANNVYGSTDYNNEVATVDSTKIFAALTRSPQVNTIYYNPAITYTPWANQDGSLYPPASPTCALHNPMRSGTTTAYCRNLTTNMVNYNGVYWNTCTSASDNNCSPTTTLPSSSFWTATYFWFTGTSSEKWTLSKYAKREIRSTTPTYNGDGRTARTDCTAGVCTYAQEIQNFANWYTYYRSRVLTARAGIGRAFSAQGTGLRVGFAAINEGSSSIDGVSTTTLISGVRQFSGTDRSNFFSDLYGHTIPAAGTPLRKALDAAGQYYSRTDDKGPWSSTPGTTGGTLYACRQSYSILMTDGYWSEGSTAYEATTSAAKNDNDSTDGTTITGPNSQSLKFTAVSPFTDGRDNTLADVAAYYWKRDLNTNLTNAVPTSTRDPAFWQHMVTFGVGLGVNGTVDPDTAFSAIGKTSPTITWPTPFGSNPGKLDDLLHASVNSRGAFFSAKDPQEFAAALTAMLNDIADRKSSSGSVSANSTRLTTSSLVFSGSFNTADWGGELAAYQITASGVTSTPVWEASSLIPAYGSRKIFTITGGNKKEFLWSNLGATDLTALTSQAIVDYLRGDRSQETSNGGTLRKRKTLLGDVVNSSPVYQKSTKTVYVGANDGMLHAFNAETGVERFAYIPSPMLAKMKSLSDSTYVHQFYVDGDMEIADQSDTGLSKSYLVGTLGRGAKGLYALDITTPASFGAANIAWEYVDSTDKSLGYMLGKPVYARMNDGSDVVILGNGYNSANGTAVLYIINLETGVAKKIDTNIGSDNGLATPGVVDNNGDGYIDYIYAGDLKGNVWKFDVSSSTATNWKGSVFFTAKDSNNLAQPITSEITSSVNYLTSDPNAGKRYIFFGTGAYFRKTDPDDKSVQTWYGLIDNGSAISGRSSLTARGLAAEFTADGKPARSFKSATAGDMTGKSGWYLDWINADGTTKIGERMVTASALYRLTEPTLLGSSIIPKADDPCQPGGTGYINAINAFTGGSLKASIFTFTTSPGASTVGSLDFGVGMPSQASLFVGDSSTGQIVVSGTGNSSGTGTGTSNSGLGGNGFIPDDKGGRIYWREINRK